MVKSTAIAIATLSVESIANHLRLKSSLGFDRKPTRGQRQQTQQRQQTTTKNYKTSQTNKQHQEWRVLQLMNMELGFDFVTISMRLSSVVCLLPSSLCLPLRLLLACNAEIVARILAQWLLQALANGHRPMLAKNVINKLLSNICWRAK